MECVVSALLAPPASLLPPQSSSAARRAIHPPPRPGPPPPLSPPRALPARLGRTVVYVSRAPRTAPETRGTGRARQGCGRGSRAAALCPGADERSTSAERGARRGPRSAGRRLLRQPFALRRAKRRQPAWLPLRPLPATDASTTSHAASRRARRGAAKSRGWLRAASPGAATCETFVSCGSRDPRGQPRPAEAGKTSSSARFGRRSTASGLGRGARC